MLPELVFYAAVSADGFLAEADGGVSFLDGYPPQDDDGPATDYGYSEFIAGIDALLMGSHTYEFVLHHGTWPYDDLPTIVLSSRDLPPMADTVRVIEVTPHDALTKLAANGARRVWLVGGSRLLRSCLELGLEPAYILTEIPVTLGDGLPLFLGDDPLRDREPDRVTRHSHGVVQREWRR